MLLRDRNTCVEHGTNFDAGHHEEFEPLHGIFATVYRCWYVQIRILGPAEHKSFDGARFFIPPPRELPM